MVNICFSKVLGLVLQFAFKKHFLKYIFPLYVINIIYKDKMQPATKLFHQKLTELTQLTQQYTNLSQENTSVNVLNQFLNNYCSDTADRLDGNSTYQRGANGTISIKQTALGSVKIYTVAANDYPIAIADKLDLTITQLAKLQVPWLVKILDLQRTGQFNYRKLVGNSRKSRNSQYWIKGFAKDWIIHPNDELLVAVPHPEVTQRAIVKANKKKEDLPWGTEFSASNGLVKGKTTQGNPEDYIDVTELFAAFGAAGSSGSISWSRAFLGLKNVAQAMQLYVGSRTIMDDIKQAIKNHTPAPKQKITTSASDPFNISVKFVNKMENYLSTIADKTKRQQVKNRINQQLAKKGLPKLGHDLYLFDGNLSTFIPSVKYKGHYIRREVKSQENEDFTTFLVITPKGLAPSPLAEGGWLNRSFQQK